MSEPSAQFVAGRQLARPLIQARALARDTARPDMVDEDPVTVVVANRVVDAFDAYISACDGATSFEAHRAGGAAGR